MRKKYDRDVMYEKRKTTSKQRQCTFIYEYKPNFVGVYVNTDVCIYIYELWAKA